MGDNVDDLNAPATKGVIAELEARIDQKIEQLRSEVNHGYRDLVERMDDGFTKVLNAFYSIAETRGKRLGEHDATDYALRSRLSTVENRLMDIEKRLNMPPAA